MRANLLEKLRCATEPEIYRALYTDALTGVSNRRAFDDDSRCFVALVDLDSLKAVNDRLGHKWGDYQLCQIAHALSDEFGNDDVYRLGGDEFAVKSGCPRQLHRKLKALQAKLPRFSFGVALGIDRADALMQQDKEMRTATGRRARRGERPAWLHELEGMARC